MNKHTRLIVSVLFIGIIVLAVAITRFYSNSGKAAVNSNSQTGGIKKLAIDGNGNRIFQTGNNVYGIIDSSDRVIVSPEWQAIEFTNGEMCKATKRIHGKELNGCIDYEGNITVPFVYSDIKSILDANQIFYIARTYDNKSTVVYDKDFNQCFSRAWDSCEYKNGELIAVSGSGSFTYYVNNTGFVLKSADVKDIVLNHEYDLKSSGLPDLTAPMIEKINSFVNRYLEYAYTGNSDVLAGIVTDSPKDFKTLFPEEKNITSKKLTEITSMNIISKPYEDGYPRYSVVINAKTSIVYKNTEGKTKRLSDTFEAEVEFTGNSADNLKAVSGSFLKEKPDYPVPEAQQLPAEQPNQTL